MVGKSYLISRTTQRYTNYASKAIKLSKSTPYTVDEVLIGKKGKSCKKITTFRDSKGNLIERIFNYKYPYEYNSRYDAIAERKDQIKEFYGKLR